MSYRISVYFNFCGDPLFIIIGFAICRYAMFEVYRRYTAVTVYLCDLDNISLSGDPQ